MSKPNHDPFDLENLRVPDEVQALARVPAKIRKRREKFAVFPMTWYEALNSAPGATYRVAIYLLYLHWKEGGGPVKLPNGMLKTDGVSRQTKWRALGDLERRGLITVERRPRRSPLVRLNSVSSVGQALSHP
jgi:hypothetical protein